MSRLEGSLEVDEHLSDMNSPLPPGLSPFDKLPTEIVEEVFSSACEDLTFPPYFDNPTVPTLLTVSLVCKKWLDIATEDHSLWATFTIRTSFLQSGFSSHLAALLQKSAACPLRISVWSGESQEVVLDAIMSHSERWERMAFHFPPQVQFLRKLDAVQDRLPLLRYLEIRGPDSQYPAGTKQLTVFSPRSAPSLAHISLKNMNDSNFRALDLPWNQISRVELDFPSFAQIRSTLQLSRNLTTLKVYTYFFGDHETIPPTRFEKLQELHANELQGNIATLTCPSLQILFLNCPRVSDVTGLLDNSHCALVHIELKEYLDDLRYDKAYSVPILWHPSLANLRSISLKHLTLNDEMLDILTMGTHSMFPLLETLRMDVKFVWKNRPDFESQIERLQRMVNSRTQAKRADKLSLDNHTSDITRNSIPSLKEFTLTLNVFARKWSEWEGMKLEELRSVLLLRNVYQTVQLRKHRQMST